MAGGVDGDYEDFTEYSERATAHAAGLLLIVVSAFWDCNNCFTSLFRFFSVESELSCHSHSHRKTGADLGWVQAHTQKYFTLKISTGPHFSDSV